MLEPRDGVLDARFARASVPGAVKVSPRRADAVLPKERGSQRTRLRRKRIVLLLALVGTAALFAPASALATTGHEFVGEFGGAGNGDGEFSPVNAGGPEGVAVMPSTGEVFTVDAGFNAEPRVQRFGADGVFLSRFSIAPFSFPGAVAVDQAGFGAVYVSARPEAGGGIVAKYSAAGVFAYELDASGSETTLLDPALGPAPLAVDPVDGTVYVAATDDSTGLPVIDRFNGSTGAFIDSFDGSGSPDGVFVCPSGLAVDGSHRVYVLDPCKASGRVEQYSADGVFGRTVDDGSRGAPRALAADPVSDEVYVAENHPEFGLQITHFSAGGTDVIYTFDEADAADTMDVKALAASGTGTVYASDASSDPARALVKQFASFQGPTVTTDPAAPVGARDATLNGTIDPEGADSTYNFEYGLDRTYGSRTPESSPESGSDPVAASAEITGLQPNKTYHYRIVGKRTSGSGSIIGGDHEFTTATAPPDPDTRPASATTPRSARLHGTVNSNNSPAFWQFEYGTTTAYGTTVPFFASVPPDGVDQAVLTDIAGLQPGTTYHYRLVARECPPFGPPCTPVPGPDQTFITAPAAGGGGTGMTTKRATLTGTINPHGEDTTYHFNYGPTSAYGSSTPEVDAGDGDGDQQVSQAVSGLSPDTTYHVQVVATSANGVKRYGGDGLFRTAPAPDAVAISPIGVSTGAATLVGDLDTHGLPGTYRFDVSSLDSSYSFSTVERAAAGNDGVERVSVSADGLPAGETFVVQLRVTSNDSTELSDLVTFATAALPKVFPPPPAGSGAAAYGCETPRLDGYNKKPKPGDTITIRGRDLGTGGTAVLGDRSSVPADWSTTQFKLKLPEDATGTLALTVNCGQRSNTVAIAIFKKPSSRFSIANTTVNGSKATVSVRVPGPGKLTSSAAKAKPGKVTIKKALVARLVVRLNRAGVRALRKSKRGRLKVPVRIRYLPAGGTSSTKKVTVTFARRAGR